MIDENADSVVELVQGLNEKSPEAAERIWQEFHDRLVRYADRKLGGLPRRVADEEDVALSAMNSFCDGMNQGRFPDISSMDDIWRILFVITDRKAKKEIRRQMARKRGGGEVRGESVFLGRDGSLGGLAELPGNGPVCSIAERLTVECEELLDRLDDQLLRKIAVLKLQGHGVPEIAESLGVATRTIERKLARIRGLWQTVSESDE